MSDLAQFRAQLDRINDELVLATAECWLQGNTTNDALAQSGEIATLLQQIYHHLANAVADPALAETLASVRVDDPAIGRIVEGMDFPGVLAPLDEETARRLEKLFASRTSANLFRLIGQRLEIVLQVAHHKAAQQIPLRDRLREADIVTRAESLARTAGIPPEAVSTLFFRVVFPIAFEVEERVMGKSN